jgi:hypothetical protein
VVHYFAFKVVNLADALTRHNTPAANMPAALQCGPVPPHLFDAFFGADHALAVVWSVLAVRHGHGTMAALTTPQASAVFSCARGQFPAVLWIAWATGYAYLLPSQNLYLHL